MSTPGVPSGGVLSKIERIGVPSRSAAIPHSPSSRQNGVS